MRGPRRASLRSYIAFIATFRWRALLVLSLFAASSALLAVIPFFVGRLVGALASRHGSGGGGVYGTVAVLVACSVGHDLTWRGSELLYLKLLMHKGYEYENVVFHSVVTERYPYFVDKFAGKLSACVDLLGKEFRTFLDELCYTYVDYFVKMPGLAVLMFTVNLYTGLVFVGSIVALVAVGHRTVGRSTRSEKVATDAASSMNGYIIDVMTNVVSVKSFGQEAAEYAQVRQRRRHVIATAETAHFWGIVFWGSMSLVVRYLVWPGAILLNVHLYLNGEIDLAQLTTFLSALLIFCDFIWGTIWQVAQLNLQVARIEEAYRYLFGERSIVAESRRTPGLDPGGPPPAYTRALQVRDLRFAYPGHTRHPVLRDISLEIGRNEKLGIVGRSGSGKTTLIKLLLGYYDLPAGALVLDGEPIDNRRLARCISYVPQDTSLFHRSIRDNITYGAPPGAGQEHVEAAARRAHAHEFIVRTPEGYDTLVGERGVKLSTGQRQRIAIARAFLDDKPILILDEATSALDSESEAFVQQALEDLWRDKTVIAIAHRLSTLLTMDRIVVLDGGRIAEQGSHHELLALDGHYRALWERQSGGILQPQ